MPNNTVYYKKFVVSQNSNHGHAMFVQKDGSASTDLISAQKFDSFGKAIEFRNHDENYRGWKIREVTILLGEAI